MDIKTKSAHFYVQRNSSFSTYTEIIPFEVERLNEGQAMDLASGVFTAPVSGIYHFEFTGVSVPADYLIVTLQVNGANIGKAYTSHLVSNNMPGSASASLSASLWLSKNDKVNLYNAHCVLYDDENHYTHFTGWLVEEDLEY